MDRDNDGHISEENFVRSFDLAGLDEVPLDTRLDLFRDSLQEGAATLCYKDFSRALAVYRVTPSLRGAYEDHLHHEDADDLDVHRDQIEEKLTRGKTSGAKRSPRLRRALARLTKPLQRSASEHHLRDPPPLSPYSKKKQAEREALAERGRARLRETSTKKYEAHANGTDAAANTTDG